MVLQSKRKNVETSNYLSKGICSTSSALNIDTKLKTELEITGHTYIAKCELVHKSLACRPIKLQSAAYTRVNNQMYTKPKHMKKTKKTLPLIRIIKDREGNGYNMLL